MKYKGGLSKWFNEEWTDLKTGEACGRESAKNSKRPYPSCRPKGVLAKMTKEEKERSKRKKTSSKRINHDVTASGKRRTKDGN